VNKIFSILFISLALIFVACKTNTKPDISKVKVKLEVLRFEKDLMKIDSSNYDQAFKEVDAKYPDFFSFYLKAVARVIPYEDTTISKDTLLHYLNDSYIKYVSDSVKNMYNNIDDIEKDLTLAFRYYKHYYPNNEIPTIVTYIDGPPYGLTYENILGIGLDGYMGEKFQPYIQIPEPIPAYALRKFNKNYMVANTMNVLASAMYPFDVNSHNLLESMIAKGKNFYFMKLMMPDVADSIILGYPEKTIKWLNENESEIWKFFVKNKLLYETDPLVFAKFVNDGPNTSGMPAEAPGNIGSWLGYKIVMKYLDKYPDINLQAFMQNMTAQQILTDSKYKPL
jgi:hypothetical protein